LGLENNSQSKFALQAAAKWDMQGTAMSLNAEWLWPLFANGLSAESAGKRTSWLCLL